MSFRVHPTAEVSEQASIGEGCIIGKGVYVGADVSVGRNCKVQNYSCVYEGNTLEDGVFVGPEVVFTNDRYPRAVNPDGTLKAASDWDLQGSTVKFGAAVGSRSVILPGLTIGRWALIAAGSVLTKDVPDHAIVAGNGRAGLGVRVRAALARRPGLPGVRAAVQDDRSGAGRGRLEHVQ